MAKLKTTSVLGAMLFGISAIAFVTNPGKAGYEKYANNTLKTKVKSEICSEAATDLGSWVEGQCGILVDTASPYISQIISQQTQRQNFFLFSIYQADLVLPSPLPTYHVETIGILGKFYTYQARKL